MLQEFMKGVSIVIYVLGVQYTDFRFLLFAQYCYYI